MNDNSIYHVQVRGAAAENEINCMSPLQATVEPAGAGATLLTACTDQAGLIGLLRHLHGLGFVVLSLKRAEGQDRHPRGQDDG